MIAPGCVPVVALFVDDQAVIAYQSPGYLSPILIEKAQKAGS
jgi:hypothetical protein